VSTDDEGTEFATRLKRIAMAHAVQKISARMISTMTTLGYPWWIRAETRFRATPSTDNGNTQRIARAIRAGEMALAASFGPIGSKGSVLVAMPDTAHQTPKA
jgi:hypothetical protein